MFQSSLSRIIHEERQREIERVLAYRRALDASGSPEPRPSGRVGQAGSRSADCSDAQPAAVPTAR